MKDNMACRPIVRISVLLLSCLVTSLASAGTGAAQREYASDFVRVWTAAIGALQGGGDAVIRTDRENGIIGTDYKAEGGKWRHKFNLLLVKKDEQHTVVSLTAVVENLSKGALTAQRWQDQKSDGTREAQLLDNLATALAGGNIGGGHQREYSSGFTSVWAATTGLLQSNGDAVIHADKESGIIGTDYKAEGKGKWRHKFNLLLTKKDEQHTVVSLTAVVENLSKGALTAQRWQDQGSDGKREAQLLDEIAAALGSQPAK